MFLPRALTEHAGRGASEAYSSSVAKKRAVGNPFRYQKGQVDSVEAALSVDRFSSYVSAAAGDRQLALRLYEWNSKVSAAFYVPLQSVEVGLRNGCHRQLSVVFGAKWHDDGRFLGIDAGFAKSITDAKDRLRRSSQPQDTPHIVAELSFGFWTTLLSRRHEHSLWVPAIRKAFPRYIVVTGRQPRRRDIADRFDYLRVFRNRIAHHEPIFSRALKADYASLLEVASWMHEDLAEWTDCFSSCSTLLREGSPLTTKTQKRLSGWCGLPF